MTQYASASDLDALAIKAAALASVSTDRKNAALLAASRKADAYLRSRHVVPLTSWDDSLRQAVACLAAWDLMRTEGFNPEGVDQTLRAAYEDAMIYLRDIGAGRATFASDATAPDAAQVPDLASDDARGW